MFLLTQVVRHSITTTTQHSGVRKRSVQTYKTINQDQLETVFVRSELAQALYKRFESRPFLHLQIQLNKAYLTYLSQIKLQRVWHLDGDLYKSFVYIVI